MSSVHSLFLLLVTLSTVKGTFLEIPANQTINVGETADFRCRHATADFITWKINDTLIANSNLPLGIAPRSKGERGGLVYTLSIVGRPEYNGTKVVGVAKFFNGLSDDETSPAAILQVSTNTTGGNMSGFVEEPLSLNLTIGEEAVFYCEYRSADAIFWRINKTSLSSRPELSDDFNDDIIGQLTVSALTKYNNTLIQCVAVFDSDNNQPETAFAILKIRGALNRVDSLVRNFTTLSWKAPFSLDLTNVEPDIVYCVDVYNITCGGRELLISDCNVTETSYTSDVIAPDGYIYEYIVTPRSNVEGAINGTPSPPLRDYLPTFTKNSTRLSVGEFGPDSNVRAYQTELIYSSNGPIPSFYSLSLQSLDGLEDMDHVETTATIEQSVLTLEVVSGLPFRRLWNCTVLAYGCQESNISNDELTTHDFRDILSSSVHPGEVRVTGSFTDDSTATGVLVIVIGDSEVIYHKASRDGTDKIKETLITGLAGGEYSISVFVVEENGIPFERVATSPKLVAVETNDIVTPPSSSIEYSLQSTSTGVCITCTFLDSSATDCVAVVHQRISQLSSSGLMNIESSHKLTRSGDTASGCIEGVNMEDYQVGVVGGRKVTIVSEKTSCVVCVSAGSVTVVLVLLVLLVSVLIVFVCKRSQQKRKGHSRIRSRSGSPTTKDHDTESGHGNEYEEFSLDNKEEVTVEMGTESTPLYSEVVSPEAESESAVGLHQTSKPVVPHRAHTVDQSQPIYVEAVISQINAVPAPPVVERQEYDQVTGFKNPEGLHYAIVDLKTKPQKRPLDDTRDRVVYSELLPQVSKDVVVDDSNEKDHHPQLAIDTPTPTPYTSSNLYTLLLPVVTKWKEFGEALSVDEDDIDEIFTNNDTDESCLCDLLDRFVTVHHNWVDVEGALRKMGEEHLAERASEHYVLPNPVQPEMTDHLGQRVLVYNSVCQPKVESSEVYPTYCTEDNVNGNVSDNGSLNGTSTSVTGLTSKSTDSGCRSWHSSEEAGEGFCQRPFFEPATPLTDCCQLFYSQLGTDEPQQQNTENVQSDGFYPQPLCETATSLTNCRQGFFTPLGTEEPQQQNTQQSVQSEHEDGCYMSAVMPSLKVSQHLHMPIEEQQRLLRCKPVCQERLWQEKSSLTDRNLPVVNRAHPLHEKPCSVKVSSVATLNSACVGQGWLPDLLESVVKLASNLPVQLSRFKMLIFMMSQEMY